MSILPTFDFYPSIGQRGGMKLYQNGDKVRYQEHLATVIECINEQDGRDVTQQGYRYYVEVRGSGSWSVPETSLVGEKMPLGAPNKIN